jgi:hypothetical protein
MTDIDLLPEGASPEVFVAYDLGAYKKKQRKGWACIWIPFLYVSTVSFCSIFNITPFATIGVFYFVIFLTIYFVRLWERREMRRHRLHLTVSCQGFCVDDVEWTPFQRQRLVFDYDNIDSCYFLHELPESERILFFPTMSNVFVKTTLPNVPNDWFLCETVLHVGILGFSEAESFVDLVRKMMERSIATPVAPNNVFKVEDSVPRTTTLATQV